MSDIDEWIRKYALLRIADIFNVSVDSLRQEYKFGEALKASTSSGLFKRNEYDQIEDDLYDVADRSIGKKLSSGNLTIQTVGDYCEHMIRCYKVKPNDVRYVLKIEKKKETF